MRKLATGYRLKRFKELLPGLDTDTLFTDYPKVLLMDLKKVDTRRLRMHSTAIHFGDEFFFFLYRGVDFQGDSDGK